MKFSIKKFFSKCYTFTEEIFNGKLYFLCSVRSDADQEKPRIQHFSSHSNFKIRILFCEIATFSQMYSEKNPLSVKPQIETLTNLAALYKITLLTILEQEYFQDITFVVGQH